MTMKTFMYRLLIILALGQSVGFLLAADASATDTDLDCYCCTGGGTCLADQTTNVCQDENCGAGSSVGTVSGDNARSDCGKMCTPAMPATGKPKRSSVWQ